MKTEILAFFGIVCLATGVEEAGIRREKPVKSHFEVLKTVHESMVYYLKRMPISGVDKYYCETVKNDQLVRIGITRRFSGSAVIEQEDDYYRVSIDGELSEFHLCAGGTRPVHLKDDIIELPRSNCTFSELFCSVSDETTFWNSAFPEVLASGEADIWTVTQKPLLKLLALKDTNGMFILQLLKKIKLSENREIWLTNADELIARQVSSTSAVKNFSQLGSYLKYSRLISSMEEDTSQPLLNTDEMIFLTLILVVSLVAWYFFERIIGLIMNCVILSRARRLGGRAMWCNVFSQNMMNFHLLRCHFPEENFRRSILDGKRAANNLYDEVFINK